MREKIIQMKLYAFVLMLLIYLLLSKQNSYGQSIQTFLSPGSFTVPDGVSSITLEACGVAGVTYIK
jgi:hypothetical protein